MATLTKDPISGEYIVKPGDTLSKIATNQGRTLAELLATNPQYSSNPNLIHPGDVVKVGNSATPSYSNLTNNNPVPTPTSTSSPNVTSFTDYLIKILKDAQQRDVTGQAALMKQSQGITGQGINDTVRNFSNPLLAPNSGTSLGMSAQNQFDPLQLSIANQQKLASQNLGNITDLIKQSSSDYQDEQDRIQRAKEAASSNPYTNYSAKEAEKQADAQKKIAIQLSNAPASQRDEQGYITPEVYRNLKAAWIIDGFSGTDFDKIFNGVINPDKMKEYGIGFITKESNNDAPIIIWGSKG